MIPDFHSTKIVAEFCGIERFVVLDMIRGNRTSTSGRVLNLKRELFLLNTFQMKRK
jgi:hypothetical protein